MTKIADVMDRFAVVISDMAYELRNNDADDNNAKIGREVEDDERGPDAAAARNNDDPDADALLQVRAGDLWLLVNRTRKMIRLAREGKVPNLEARGPLCRSIKALKAAGLVKKPHNIRD